MTTYIIIVFLLLVFNMLILRIPKIGRAPITKGEIIECTITNFRKKSFNNIYLHAEGGGRKFKVKLRSEEAHLWIKGDKIEVIVSEENKKEYRVLFFDYFRENEERIRNEAISLLGEKTKKNSFSQQIVKIKEETLENIKESKLDSQEIFSLYLYMRLLDSYVLTTVIFGVLSFIAKEIYTIPAKVMLLPIAVVGVLLWYIYNAKTTCERIIKKAQKAGE